MDGDRSYAVLAKVFRTVAHDINNVLQAVSSTAELMAAREELPEDVRRKSERMYVKAQEAALRLDRLAALARIGSAGERRLDVGVAVADALALEQRDLSRARIELAAPQAFPTLFTMAAPGHVEFLLVQLLMDVERQFAGNGGALTVSLASAGGRIELTLRARVALPQEADGPGALAEGSAPDFAPAERLAQDLQGELSVLADRETMEIFLRLPRAS